MGSTAAAARAPISTSSPLRRKQRSRPVWKPIAPHRTSGGTNMRRRAFDWFIGWNDLGLELYSPETGGCRDGLHVDRVNGNQGAESTLAFLLSLAEMQLAQNMVTSFREPIAITRIAGRHIHAPQTYRHNPPSRPVPRPPAAVQSGRSRADSRDHRQDHGASGRPGRPAAGRRSPPSSLSGTSRSAALPRTLRTGARVLADGGRHIRTKAAADRLLFPGRILSGIRCPVQSFHRAAP